MVITTSEAWIGCVGKDCRSSAGDVDAFLGHGCDGDGIDLVGRNGSGGANLDPAAGKCAEVTGGHLGAASVVDADEQH